MLLPNACNILNLQLYNNTRYLNFNKCARVNLLDLCNYPLGTYSSFNGIFYI